MSGKVRADLLLVSSGLVETRAKAQALIMAGKVSLGDRRIDKPGDSVPEDAELVVKGEVHPYVSRGGVKLAGALDTFACNPAGKVVADIGASTGGFTDCVLQRGATRVYAIDVGYGQLADKLRNDPRVVVMERTNARHLTPTTLPEPMDLVVIDASFIGLMKLLPAAREILRVGGEVVALVKPQFEVGKENIGKGGVVRDTAVRDQAITDTARDAVTAGFRVLGQADCVIKGPKGNHEAFLHLERLPAP